MKLEMLLCAKSRRRRVSRSLATFMVLPRLRRDARERGRKCLWQHKRFNLASLPLRELFFQKRLEKKSFTSSLLRNLLHIFPHRMSDVQLNSDQSTTLKLDEKVSSP